MKCIIALLLTIFVCSFTERQPCQYMQYIENSNGTVRLITCGLEQDHSLNCCYCALHHKSICLKPTKIIKPSK